MPLHRTLRMACCGRNTSCANLAGALHKRCLTAAVSSNAVHVACAVHLTLACCLRDLISTAQSRCLLAAQHGSLHKFPENEAFLRCHRSLLRGDLRLMRYRLRDVHVTLAFPRSGLASLPPSSQASERNARAAAATVDLQPTGIWAAQLYFGVTDVSSKQLQRLKERLFALCAV